MSAARHPLIRALGGVLGIVETLVPPLIFVVCLAITGEAAGLPWLAMITSSVAAVGFIAVRLIQRERVTQALAGLISVMASVLLAVFTHRAENNFVIGIWSNTAYGLAFLVSIAVRWPIVGIVVGFLSKRGHGWRSRPAEKRMFSWLTLMWAGMFALRVAIELPFYFAGNVAALAVTKLVLGIPFYAPLFLVSWLFVRGMFIEEDQEKAAESSKGA